MTGENLHRHCIFAAFCSLLKGNKLILEVANLCIYNKCILYYAFIKNIFIT